VLGAKLLFRHIRRETSGSLQTLELCRSQENVDLEATILAWAVGVPAFALPVTLLAALEGPVIIMENIHRLLTVSVWEFMQNSEKAVEDALGQPVAVLNDNRVVFYAVSPELMAQMADMYDERLLAMLVASRLKSMSRAVKVNLDDL
jgi:antitoxin StbD